MDKKVVTSAWVLGLVSLLLLGEWLALNYVQGLVQDNLISNSQREAETRSSQIALLLEVELRNLHEKLNLLSLHPAVSDGNTPECNEAVKEALPRFAPKIGSLNRFDETGLFDCSTISSVIGYKSATSDFDQLLYDSGHPTFLSRISYSSFSGHYVSAMQVPIIKSGEFKGSLGGAVYVDELNNRYLQDKNLSGGGSVVLVDDDGNILYSDNNEIIGKNLLLQEDGLLAGVTLKDTRTLPEVLEDVFSGENGSVLYDSNNNTYIASYSSANILPGRKWIVIVIVPQSLAVQALTVSGFGFYNLNLFAVLMTASVILVIASALVLMSYLVWGVFTPIERLTVYINEISMGDLGVEIDPKLKKGNDEISRLANAFERTLVSMKLAMKKLNKKPPSII